MKATFENTVDILVKAYLNDTLAHGTCFACAVGNIVAHSMGKKVIRFEKARIGTFSWSGCDEKFYPAYMDANEIGGWGAVFYTSTLSKKQIITLKNYFGVAKKQIDSTGYSVEQLAQIEEAFELSEQGDNNEEWMFNGLMAVVDVLADIHGIDLKVKEEAKLLFVKS